MSDPNRPSGSLDSPAVPRSPFRPEIQALRAFAVVAVVLNHLWPERLGGGFVGVDVFFVISGFLISNHLLGEIARTGRIRLGAFWARRARRLLPAALLVLLVSALTTAVVIPVTEWQAVFPQIGASALYLQNWQLIATATDYFTSAQSPSPVTHYWSLSVEEQFYLVWPFLLLIGAVVSARRRPRGLVVGTAIVIAIVVVASFAYSVRLTGTTPSAAYFSTLTRAWEFGAGALLAALAAKARLPRIPAAVISWAGWLGLAASLVLITEQTPFPGAAAALPVVATALVILGGSPRGALAPTRLASLRPVQFLGDISYSLYLWHWLPIIALPHVLHHPLGWRWKLGILAGAIVVAALQKRFVEDPARRWSVLVRGRSWRTYVAMVVGMALVVSACATGYRSVDVRLADVETQLAAAVDDAPPCFAAAARAPGADCADRYTLRYPDAPLLTAVNQGNPVQNGSTCQQEPTVSTVLTCDFGVDAADASLTIALTGDSHAGHYVAALDRLAMANRWHVVMYVKSSCPTLLSDDVAAAWDWTLGASCRAWNDAIVPEIASRSDIDVVVTSSIAREYARFDDAGGLISYDTSDAYAAAWREWTAAGKKVFVIGDVPHMQLGDIPTCIATEGADDPCTQKTSIALTPDPMLVAAAAAHDPDIASFDPNEFICGSRRCHSVVGGIPVFADQNHLSRFFSASLAPYLGRAIDELVHR
ncbi:acyltransferase family protein [Galbitalea sp. SE-J8]|uniref:acyltransferase family protein n=1 Tax=Galbitalea sp. SE-J8 TaxID=3054952 RepID=UPI00259CDC61|nr:acyltransferase family protein [Galbitalea sp. SE-J8]MDM4762963.1 acyltransferase family protein [Galbitalea sp. SE-J8]